MISSLPFSPGETLFFLRFDPDNRPFITATVTVISPSHNPHDRSTLVRFPDGSRHYALPEQLMRIPK